MLLRTVKLISTVPKSYTLQPEIQQNLKPPPFFAFLCLGSDRFDLAKWYTPEPQCSAWGSSSLSESLSRPCRSATPQVRSTWVEWLNQSMDMLRALPQLTFKWCGTRFGIRSSGCSVLPSLSSSSKQLQVVYSFQTHQTKFTETNIAGSDVLPLDAGVPGTFGCILANRPQVSWLVAFLRQ